MSAWRGCYVVDAARDATRDATSLIDATVPKRRPPDDAEPPRDAGLSPGFEA